jgi:hypothetical protein
MQRETSELVFDPIEGSGVGGSVCRYSGHPNEVLKQAGNGGLI